MNNSCSSASNDATSEVQKYFTSKTFLWVIILIGVVLRIARYIYNPSLYFDEADTAIDIISRTFSELLHSSPDYDQTYPFSFLILTKLSIGVFTKSEYALRVVPLFWGSMSVILFYYLAKHYLEHNAALIALLFFAMLDPVVYYSSIVKPYSGDVACALIVLVLVIYFQSKEINFVRILLFAFGGAVVIWLSNASVFVLAGTGIGLVINCISKKEWQRLKSLLFIFLFWAGNFLAYYFIYLKQTAANIGLGVEEMLKMEQAYMPFPPKSINDIKWYIDTFFNTFHFHDLLEFGSRVNLTGIVAMAFLVGCVSFFKRNRADFLILIGPIAATLLASAMHKYPFKGRLILFLAPFFVIFIAEGIKRIWEKSRHNSLAIGVIFAILIFIYPVSWAAYHVKKPISRSEMRPVLNYIQDYWKPGDIIYVHYYAQYEFDYYSKYHPQAFNFNEDEYVIGIAPRGWYNRWKKQEVSKYYDPEKEIVQTRGDILNQYIKDLKQLQGNKRVWILFSGQTRQGSIKEEDFFLLYLDSVGERLDTFGKSATTVAYLYDLS